MQIHLKNKLKDIIKIVEVLLILSLEQTIFRRKYVCNSYIHCIGYDTYGTPKLSRSRDEYETT